MNIDGKLMPFSEKCEFFFRWEIAIQVAYNASNSNQFEKLLSFIIHLVARFEQGKMMRGEKQNWIQLHARGNGSVNLGINIIAIIKMKTK